MTIGISGSTAFADDAFASGFTQPVTRSVLAGDWSAVFFTQGWAGGVVQTITVSDGQLAADGASWGSQLRVLTSVSHGQMGCILFRNKPFGATGSVTVTATSTDNGGAKGIACMAVSGSSGPDANLGTANDTPSTATDGVSSGLITPSSQPLMVVGLCLDVPGNVQPSAGSAFTSNGSGWGFGGTPLAATAEFSSRLTSTSSTDAKFTIGISETVFAWAVAFLEAAPPSAGSIISAPSIRGRVEAPLRSYSFAGVRPAVGPTPLAPISAFLVHGPFPRGAGIVIKGSGNAAQPPRIYVPPRYALAAFDTPPLPARPSSIAPGFGKPAQAPAVYRAPPYALASFDPPSLPSRADSSFLGVVPPVQAVAVAVLRAAALLQPVLAPVAQQPFAGSANVPGIVGSGVVAAFFPDEAKLPPQPLLFPGVSATTATAVLTSAPAGAASFVTVQIVSATLSSAPTAGASLLTNPGSSSFSSAPQADSSFVGAEVATTTLSVSPQASFVAQGAASVSSQFSSAPAAALLLSVVSSAQVLFSTTPTGSAGFLGTSTANTSFSPTPTASTSLAGSAVESTSFAPTPTASLAFGGSAPQQASFSPTPQASTSFAASETAAAALVSLPSAATLLTTGVRVAASFAITPTATARFIHKHGAGSSEVAPMVQGNWLGLSLTGMPKLWYQR